jgi:GSH-dependent disulfide-bond oxidoreductase
MANEPTVTPSCTVKFPDDFPITRTWPPRHPDRIQLYSINSPNGVKASVMLEETGLPYEPHLVRFDQKQQLSADFRSLNPYAKIPAMIEPLGPDGSPLALFESGAILIYLADKSGKFLASSGTARYETLQWLMFTSANISPIFGRLGFFHKFAGKEYEDKRPRDRYVAESRRLLDVIEERLATREWIMGEDFTVADIGTFPMIRNLIGYYGAGELVGIKELPNVQRALAAFVARPAVARAVRIPSRE